MFARLCSLGSKLLIESWLIRLLGPTLPLPIFNSEWNFSTVPSLNQCFLYYSIVSQSQQ
jgi:hypothetical protein